MNVVYTLIIGAVSFPWALNARDAWRNRKIVRRETAMLDEELDLLA